MKAVTPCQLIWGVAYAVTGYLFPWPLFYTLGSAIVIGFLYVAQVSSRRARRTALSRSKDDRRRLASSGMRPEVVVPRLRFAYARCRNLK
jgi:hypothetical protein